MLFVILAGFLFAKTHAGVYDVNSTNFQTCKVEYSRSQATYTRFFKFTEEHRPNNSLVIDFHFSVLAPDNAHILFAPSNQLRYTDPVYEIVLGAGKNTFSEIRRLQKASVQRSVRTKDLLSPLDVTSFWIHYSKDGLLEVGKEGNELAFLSYKDPKPLEITTFSFCTWPGVEAKWYYDCKREDGTNSESKEVEKELTDEEKLKQFLFDNYDIFSRPVIVEEDLTIIKLGIKMDRLELNEAKSKLSLRGNLYLEWIDEKINWNPDDYGNIQKLQLKLYEIWTPNLMIYNSVSVGKDYTTKNWLSVNSEGFVSYKKTVSIHTWCDAYGLGHWPADEHVCDIQFGFMAQHPNIVIEPNDQQFINFNINRENSQWKILNISTGLFFMPVPWNMDTDENFSSTFVLKINFKRSSQFYTTVYFTPLVAVSLSLLSSFLLSPFGPYKISLNCLQIIILSLILVNIATFIPAHPIAVPRIVQLYTYGIITCTISLLFAVVVINWSRVEHTKPLPFILNKLLTSEYAKVLLNINVMKPDDDYNKLTEEVSASSVKDVQNLWIMLAVALDRFLFIVCFLIVLVSLVKHY